MLRAVLLAMATAAWVASYAQLMAFGFDASKWHASVVAVDGEFSFIWARATLDRPKREGWLTSAYFPFAERMSSFVRRASMYKGKEVAAMGFGYVRTSYDATRGGVTSHGIVWLPLWFPCLIVSVPVAAAYRRWSRLRHRVAAGLCIACGYDLRGSTSRCPECGNASDQRAAVQPAA